MIAALFVAKGGCYFGLPNVDPWDEERDARRYAGPWPVVAHPPCATWGKFARQGWTKRPLGEDDGCFESALASVRIHGGVLEHPAGSSAFRRFGISPTYEVNQGDYGFPCQKKTWLYAPQARTGPVSLADPRPMVTHAKGSYDRLSRRQRAATPPVFRDLLISMAESCRRPEVYIDGP